MIPLFHGLMLAVFLFVIGFTGIVVRRSFVFILFSLEIMINAVGLVFVILGNHFFQADGQIIYIFVITVASAEASVFLALLLRLYRLYHNVNIDIISEMRG